MTDRTVDLQEILFAEREGARIARDLIEAGKRLLDLLRPAMQKNREVGAAMLAGYVSAMIDDMPSLDPRMLLEQTFGGQLSAGFSEESIADLIDRVTRRLDERRSRAGARKTKDGSS
jgi:hypothetical protein